ncbi:MAG: hypothetical protein QOH97_4905, partial [Actinoplanes sp.]|nr:hypothetical protein [Actinoplanes sp.]
MGKPNSRYQALIVGCNEKWERLRQAFQQYLVLSV